MRTIVLSALITLLGLQSIRLFTTGLVWVVGETSDRILLGALALAAFASAIFAWPLIRLIGWRSTALAAASMLALARVADQVIANPVADVYLGLAGTLAFGWLAVAFLGAQGRKSGVGLVAGMGLDVAARAVFLTVDVPFSSSPAATAVTIATSAGLVILALGHRKVVGPEQARSSFRWTAAGMPSGLLLFILVSGNFGQVSATGGLDWSSTAAWVTAGAVIGLGWAALPSGGRWKTAQLVAAVGLLATGLVLFREAGFGWGAAPLGAAVARLLAWMPVTPDAKIAPDTRIGARVPAIAITFGFVVFFVLMFAFYSFYSPEWILFASALVTGLAGAFGAFRLAAGPATDRGTAAVVLVLLLAAGLPGAARAIWDKPEVQPSAASSRDTIRVISYNIRQGFGLSNRWDLEAVAAEIERYDPDIVALQEVGRGWIISGMSDQLFWLSRRLGMRAQFGSNIGDLWGNAVLTNFVARSEGHHFENPGRVPRGVLDTLTLFGGSGLRVLVTHLDHEDDGSQTRLDQIDTLLDIWGGDPQTLVLGDFNAEPDSMEYRRLIDAGLRDLLSESGNPSPTRPSDDPVTRIDYAFASPGLELERASTPKSLASDHLPILVELRIP